MKLPPGVVLNPTVIAMEKEARERAERAKASGKVVSIFVWILSKG